MQFAGFHLRTSDPDRVSLLSMRWHAAARSGFPLAYQANRPLLHSAPSKAIDEVSLCLNTMSGFVAPATRRKFSKWRPGTTPGAAIVLILAITVNSYRKLGAKKFVYPVIKISRAFNQHKNVAAGFRLMISPAGRRPDYDAGCRQINGSLAHLSSAGGGGLDNKPASELLYVWRLVVRSNGADERDLLRYL